MTELEGTSKELELGGVQDDWTCHWDNRKNTVTLVGKNSGEIKEVPRIFWLMLHDPDHIFCDVLEEDHGWAQREIEDCVNTG